MQKLGLYINERELNENHKNTTNTNHKRRDFKASQTKLLRRYGKLYGSIDFEINENVSGELFNKQPEKPVIGKLMIGGKTFDVTYQELDSIIGEIFRGPGILPEMYNLDE